MTTTRDGRASSVERAAAARTHQRKLRRCRAAPRRRRTLRSRFHAVPASSSASTRLSGSPARPYPPDNVVSPPANVVLPLEIRRRLHRLQRCAASQDPVRPYICRTDQQWPPPTMAVSHVVKQAARARQSPSSAPAEQLCAGVQGRPAVQDPAPPSSSPAPARTSSCLRIPLFKGNFLLSGKIYDSFLPI